MIRRDAGDDFLLITQTDHAALSAAMAAHFGAGRFARPMPREPVLTAIAQHDAGWPLHDDAPTLNARGRPLDVFEVPRQIALKVWAASADRAEAIDPYAGLLVSLHSLSLSIYASTHAAPPVKIDAAHLQAQFDLNKFQHREVERQEQLRQKLGFRTDVPLKHGLAGPGVSDEDDRLRFHFRLLQAMDLLSLCACCTHPPASGDTELLPSPTASPVRLKIHRGSEGVTHVRPWFFDAKRLDLKVPCRRVHSGEYESVEQFNAIYQQAVIEELAVTLLP